MYVDMNKSILMSLTSIDSAHFEEPPAYNAALQYPVCLFDNSIFAVFMRQ